MLVPPANFGVIEEGIYRCSKVETLNLSFLETLSLKIVLFIGGTEPSKFFREFFNTSNIKWSVIRTTDFSSSGITIRASSKSALVDPSNNIRKTVQLIESKPNCAAKPKEPKEKYHLNDADNLMLIKSHCLKKAIMALLNKDNYNILLVDRTSVIAGVLRKIQRWSISSIINEYRLFAGKNSNYFAETFLELLEVEVEQLNDDKDCSNEPQGVDVLNSNVSPLPMLDTKTPNRDFEIVTEESLSESPKVPQRMLDLIQDLHQIAPPLQNGLSRSSSSLTEQSRLGPSLGVFGNVYRLAFTKKEQGDFEYYKNRTAEGQDIVKIKVPSESKLPFWFKFQRDLWEKTNVPEEHHFYKEQIFL